MPDGGTGQRERVVRASSVLASLGLPVVATTLDGTIVVWNQAAEHLFGHPAAVALGRNVMQLLVPRSMRERAKAMVEAVTGGESWQGSFTVTRADGRPLRVEVVDAPIVDDAGEVVGVVGISRDLTDDLRTGQALRENRDALRSALAAGRFGTWRWDMASGVVEWDAQLEAIFGLEPGTFDGTFETYQSLLHPDDRDQVLATVAEAVASKSDYDIEHRVIWPDGSVHWLEGRGSVTLDADGEVTGTQGCTGDITESVLRASQTMELAASLQSGLLPNLPVVPGLRVASRYQPGEERLLLGGDFLDVVVTPTGAVAFCIGDVAGHGAVPAAVGASLRAGWRALALTGDDPAAWLRGCATLLAAAEPPPELFVTMTTGLVSADHTVLTVVSAGHPAPILAADGAAASLAVEALPPLGLLAPGSVAEPAVHDLPGRWRLLLFTDGLFEGRAAPGSSVRLGVEQLERWCADGPVAALDDAALDRLVSLVIDANGGPLVDDIACLALAVEGGTLPADGV